jgi:protein transport protein SEC31
VCERLIPRCHPPRRATPRPSLLNTNPQPHPPPPPRPASPPKNPPHPQPPNKQYGLLAGGLADGSVCLWDPAALLAASSSSSANGSPKAATGKNPLLARMSKHAASVKGLGFNPFSPNLLASGGADGELCVWDVANPAAPSLYPPLRVPTNPGGGGGGGQGGAAQGGAAGGGQQGGPTGGGGGGATNPSAGHDITSLAWNRKVQHIIATTHGDGSTVVWDLKKQRPVITLRDASAGPSRRAAAVAWSPEVATQLVVASDDDRSPTLQAWDLRSAGQPLREFVGHHRGVLALDWCPHDPALLLSCARDGRAICWDALSGDAVCELAAGASPASSASPGGPAASAGGAPLQDVRWSPKAPGVFAVAGGNGRAALHALEACTGGGMVETINPADFSVTSAPSGEPPRPLRRAPAWMSRPCSVAWGFGGTLASVSNSKAAGAAAAVDPATGQPRPAVGGADVGVVELRQVAAGDPALAAGAEAFEAALLGGGGGDGGGAPPSDLGALRAFCAAKAGDALARAGAGGAEGAGDDDGPGAAARREAETWSFVGLLFEADARRQLLAHLGLVDPLKQQQQQEQQQLEQQQQAEGGEQADAAAAGAAAGTDGGAPPPPPHHQEDDGDFFNRETVGGAGDGAGFFDRLQTNGGGAGAAAGAGNPQHQQQPGTPPGAPPAPTTAGGAADDDAAALAADLAVGAEAEEEIQRALLVADYSRAVDACFRANRPADALLIANLGGESVWQRAVRRHTRRSPRPFMAIVRAVLDGDLHAFVKSRPVAQWRETLAALATFAGPEQWGVTCEVLAARLAAAGNAHAACLCRVVALDVDGAVAHWARTLQQAQAQHAQATAGGKAPAPDAAAAASSMLQGVVEKAVVMGLAAAAQQGGHAALGAPASAVGGAGSGAPPGALGEVVATYAGELAAQGKLQAAMRLLELAPGADASPAVAELRDRVYRSGAAVLQGVATAAPPPFPFVQEEVSAYVVPPLEAAAQPPQPQQQMQQMQPQHSMPQQQQQGYGGYQQQQPQLQQPQQQAYGGYGAQQQQQQQQQQQPYGAGGGYGGGGGYGAAPPAAPPQQQQQHQPYGGGYGQQPPTPGSAGGRAYAPQQQQQQQPYGGYGAPPPQQQQHPQPPASAAPPPAPPAGAFMPGPAAGGQYGAPPPSSPAPYAPQQQQPMQQQAPAQQPTFFTPGAAGPGGPMGAPPPSGAGMPPYGAPPPPAQQLMQPPGGGPMHPMMPQQQPMMQQQMQQQQAPPPPPPAGPPPHLTLQTADSSRVPADQKPIVAQLHALYNACAPLANNPARKREMDDNSKRLGQLVWRLNEGGAAGGAGGGGGGGVSPHVVARLQAMSAALARGDWAGAAAVQVELTATDWDECGAWLTAVKRLVKVRQMVG